MLQGIINKLETLFILYNNETCEEGCHKVIEFNIISFFIINYNNWLINQFNGQTDFLWCRREV